MTDDEMEIPRKHWLKINDQAIVRYAEPLNPGFVFWLRRRFRARIISDGGERVTMTRREPFSDAELQEIYFETEHRQQRVSLPIPKYVFVSIGTLVERAKASGKVVGVRAVKRMGDDSG